MTLYRRRPKIGGIEAQKQWFWEQSKQVDSGCREWQRSTDTVGYGNCNWEGRKSGTHRISWILTFGPIPEGMDVLHRCDNRRCVNPSHLYLGDHARNMRDKAERGRSHNIPKGQDNARAKLTNADAAEIKELVKRNLKYADISQRFGVSRTVISRIVLGKSYQQ